MDKRDVLVELPVGYEDAAYAGLLRDVHEILSESRS